MGMSVRGYSAVHSQVGDAVMNTPILIVTPGWSLGSPDMNSLALKWPIAALLPLSLAWKLTVRRDVAITFVGEAGDIRRFATPAFDGFSRPRSVGTHDPVTRCDVDQEGMDLPARVSETLRGGPKDLSLTIRSIAWKAQVRLSPATVG
jgi:hypothetical protein